MPAMVHLTRLGYSYFGKISEDGAGSVYDADTNILLRVFEQQFKRLNPGHEGEFLQVLRDIRKELNDDDLGLHEGIHPSGRYQAREIETCLHVDDITMKGN